MAFSDASRSRSRSHSPKESSTVDTPQASHEVINITVLTVNGSTVTNMRLESAANENVLKQVTVSELVHQLSDITGLPPFRLQLINGTSKLSCTQTLQEAGLQSEACLCLVKIGSMLLTASEDCSAKLWNCETGACVQTMPSTRGMLSAEFAPTGSSCFVTSSETAIDVWTMEKWIKLASQSVQNGIISWSKDAPSVFVALPTGDIEERFVYAKDGEAFAIHLYRGHEARACSATHSNDHTMVLSCSADRTAKLWQRRDAFCTWTFIGHADVVNSAEFSSDDSRVVTSSSDHTAKVFCVASGNVLLTLQHGDVVSCARFSNDSNTILTACHDSHLRLWDIERLRDGALGKCLRIFEGHQGAVLDARFSADGKRIGSASRDGFAKLWDVDSGECVQTFEGHKGAVVSVSFSL